MQVADILLSCVEQGGLFDAVSIVNNRISRTENRLGAAKERKAAVETGAPIIPVAVAGAREILREKTWLPRPGNVTITLSKPIYPPQIPSSAAAGGTKDSGDWHALIQLRDTAREAIARDSGEPLL